MESWQSTKTLKQIETYCIQLQHMQPLKMMQGSFPSSSVYAFPYMMKIVNTILPPSISLKSKVMESSWKPLMRLLELAMI